MPFAFLLFAILGWCVFTQEPQPPSKSRIVLMVVFIVLMAIWLIFGVTGFDFGKWKP